MNKKLLNINIFIMIFFSSIIGGSFFGVSLNKVCIIPMYMYLFLTSDGRADINKKNICWIAFFAFSSFSALLSLTADYSNIEGYRSKSILYIIQSIVIYIPLILLLSGNRNKKQILDTTKSMIVLTARINVIIAIIEFVSFFVVDVELTKIILDFLYSGNGAPALINLPPLGIFLRPTGLNMDPAYLGIILSFAFVFEKDDRWKIAFFLVVLLAMSRTAIIIMVIVYLYNRGLKKPTYKQVVFLLIGIFVFGFLVIKNENFSSQIMGLLNRFNISAQATSEDVGSIRHVLYIPKSVEIFLFQYNPIQMLFGFGPRQSGVVLAHSHVMDRYLNFEMFYKSWAIECDIAELLLGYGLIGFILYFYSVFALREKGKMGKTLFLIIALYSIMYDISAATFVLLIITIFLCCAPKETDCKSVREIIEK